MPHRLVPKSVIKRLPIYLRILDQLVHRDVEVISSKELSEETGFTPEQIRKDFAYFGAFGTRGTGYYTRFLRNKILKIIGLDRKTNVVVVGAGHLGIAFTRYTIRKNPYVNVVAVFDNDPEVVGTGIVDLEVKHVSDMEQIIRYNDIKVAINSTPADYAQEVADMLVKCGITAILNFAPVKINSPEDVYIHNVDLTNELQSLIYYSTAEHEKISRLNKEKKDDQSKMN